MKGTVLNVHDVDAMLVQMLVLVERINKLYAQMLSPFSLYLPSTSTLSSLTLLTLQKIESTFV